MTRQERVRQRGGSRLNLVLTLLFLGATVFVAVKVIPPYFANYQFQDSMETEARFAMTGYPKKTEDDIRDDIWKKAQELSIPIKKEEDIQVSMDQGIVNISTNYTVPVDLAIYQFNLQFHPHADNHTI